MRESIADDDGNLVILKKKATEECEGRPVLTILPLSDVNMLVSCYCVL